MSRQSPFPQRVSTPSPKAPLKGAALRGSFLVVLLTAFVLIVAGCIGGSSKLAPESEGELHTGPAPAWVEAHDGTGALAGTVIDAELRPIGAARIQVVAEREKDTPPIALTSDQGGRFTVQGLQGGTYLVYASKEGYREAPPKPVQAVEGTTVEVRLILERLPSPDPFHESRTWRFQNSIHRCVKVVDVSINCNIHAFIGWSISPFTYTNDKLPDVHPLRTIAVELVWTDADSFCRAGERLDIFSPDEPAPRPPNNDGTNRSLHSPNNPYYWNNLPNVTSPIRRLVQRDGDDPDAMWSPRRTELAGGRPINLTGKWTVNHTIHPRNSLGGSPVFLSCVTHRDYSLWVTAFYVSPAPNDWSIFNGGKT